MATEPVQSVQTENATREAILEAVGNRFRSATGWCIGIGIALLLLGMVAIAAPHAATLALEWFLGIILGVGGMLQLLFAFGARSAGQTLWQVLGGILSLVAAGIFLFNPFAGAVALTLVLGVFFLLAGMNKLALAFVHRGHPAWAWLAFNGGVTLILGVMILMQWPGDSLWVIGILVGVDCLLAGWSLVMLGLAGRKALDAPAQ